MELLKELLPNYFEKIKTAEVEPGFILMVLIWLFSSFFSKKKIKKRKPIINDDKISQKFGGFFEKLGNFSDLNIDQSDEQFINLENEYFNEETIDSTLESKDIQTEKRSIKNEIDLNFSNHNDPKSNLESIVETKSSSTYKEIKLYGTRLQKVMVLKEILDKPRSLRPFAFENYD